MENEMDRTEIEKGTEEMSAAEKSAAEKSAAEKSAVETPVKETLAAEIFDSGNVSFDAEEVETPEKEKGVKSKFALLVGLGILIFALSFLYGMRFLQHDIGSKQPDVVLRELDIDSGDPNIDSRHLDIVSKQLDANPPPYGWEVTEDLGVGDVPGGPTAQRFVVEHDNGWEVLAYCLEPDEPPPPIGAVCDLVEGDTFWCGDEYQLLRRYKIVQTPPPPAQTNTATSAATQISTSTPTATATNTPTFTPTATNTSTPTPTNTPSSTPTSTATSTPRNTAVPNQAFTATPRPKMGGDGNLSSGDILRLAMGIGLISISGVLAAIEGKRYLTKRAKK